MLLQELEYRAAVLKDLGEHNGRLQQAYQKLAEALRDIEQEHVAIQTLVDETPWLKDINAGANTLAGLVAQTLTKHPGNGDLAKETTARKLLVQDLKLPQRVYNCLIGHRIETVEELCQWNWSSLCAIQGLGKGGRQNIVDALAQHGLGIADAMVKPTPPPAHLSKKLMAGSLPIAKLNLTNGTRKALADHQIQTVDELRSYSVAELLKIPGFNRTVLKELKDELLRHGLGLKD